jgi:putative (di)nucleoside polyphosphate hydrolase
MPPASPRPYRPCIGIMLLNPAGLVWIGKRHPDTGADDTHCWQMPQGGIDDGETPLGAARRELFEETSIRSASLLAEAPNWISYDYPPQVARSKRTTRYCGQTQKWFAFRFEGNEAEIDILNPPDGHKPEFCEWRWARASELADLIIPFKRATYEAVVDAFGALTA